MQFGVIGMRLHFRKGRSRAPSPIRPSQGGAVHPNSVDLHAGLFGLALEDDSYDLGRGVTLSKTYAHFMAPFIMAFKPASPGKHHPAPWKPAKGGIYIDVTTELSLPAITSCPQFDRVNTVWWIVALMRLNMTTAISLPVISSEKFALIPDIEQEPSLWPMEIHTPRLFPEDSQVKTVGTNEIEWLRRNWFDAAVLWENSDFSFALQAVDGSLWNHTPALALVALWGALERLFSPSTSELSFRVSANIAAYLEPTGPARFDCFRRVKGLYDSGSKVAHGAEGSDPAAYVETYQIAKRVLMKIIEARHVPTKKELEANLFAGSAPPSTS